MQNEQTSVCEHSERPTTLYDPAIPLPPPFALIGREQELECIKQHLAARVGNAALTILHGLPGVGKTSLAITLAHDPEIRASFANGILWVGVGPNPNLSSLLSRWASLLGLSATHMTRLREVNEWASAIRAAIGQRNMLVIIDDVWQLGQVQALRVGAHRCAHLVTTRFPAIAAHLAGDGGMLISELNKDASVQLLRRAAQEGVSHEAQKARDLVQAVGGLPLALTLLGNYLRKQASHEPLTATMARLSEASVRLQISEPHVCSEHPNLSNTSTLSLQSVIAVSDQLLADVARTAFYRLAILPPKPNTFSEEVALAVTASTFEELDALSDAGLLENSGGRCTLHQVIADYAHIHLHEQQEHDAYDRLITYIADYTEAHKKDYELLDLESNTISLVLSKAHEQEKQAELIRVVCAFVPFLILRGFYQEAQRHLKRANQAARTLNNNEGIIATLLHLGEIEQRLGNYSQATNSLQEGLTLAHRTNSNERVCALLTQLGLVFQQQGNFPQAETVYQEGLTLARSIADQISICTLLNNLGWLNIKRGEFVQSERYLQEGLTLARKIADRERVCGLLRMLGTLVASRGDFGQAQIDLQEGLIIARQLGDSEQICVHLISLGLIAAKQGKNSQAKMYDQEGLELARQIGHREHICLTLMNLGDVFVEENNYIQAETSFREGLELARLIGHREWISSLLTNLGMTTGKQGHYDVARLYLEESLDLANQIKEPRIICIVLYELGSISLLEGKTDSANEAFKKMLEMAPVGDQELLAFAYYGRAQVSVLYGEMKTAKEYAEKSVTVFEAMKHRKADEVKAWIKATF